MDRHHIEMIYEDQDLAVCRKIAGVAVHTPKAGQQDMVSLLRNYFAKKDENSQIFVVHRLDQPVEGIMVFARNKQAAASLSSQSREKQMDKFYLAVAEGIFQHKSGSLEDYLLRNGKENISRVVPMGTEGAKRARLSYQVKDVWQAENLSLVQVRLETGRHHQIRVQMAHAGHPLAGDRKYNPNRSQHYYPVGLCSVKIAFTHPFTGASLEFSVQPQGSAFVHFFERGESRESDAFSDDGA